MRMSCNSKIHDELNNMDESVCPFCCELLKEGDKLVDQCCDKQDILEDAYLTVCQNCGTQSYKYTSNYIDFYENMHRIWRKSTYHRKYHIENVLNDICYKHRIDLTHTQRDKINALFRVIGNVIHLVSKDRKRMISTKYVMRKLFELLDIPHEIIDISKSHKTLFFYNRYWSNILALKYTEILHIIRQ